MARILLLLAVAWAALGAPPGVADPLSPELRQALRQGGQVIFLRHAFADEGNDQDPKTLGPCSLQRRLSPNGRVAAHDIARAFAHLTLPVGRVVVSPYCRAMETAAIAFGPMAVDHRLRLWQGELTEQEKAELPAAVKRMLATRPAPGSNTVLVSHNSKDALGIDLDQGEAAVVRPEGGDSFTVLAKLKPADWDPGAPAVDDDARPSWIVAEYALEATPLAVTVSSDGAPYATLADGALARLDPFIGAVSRTELPGGGETRKRPVVVPAGREVRLGKVAWSIAADGGITYVEPGAAPVPLRLPGKTVPVHDVVAAGDRLWLSRPGRDALLMIRRP